MVDRSRWDPAILVENYRQPVFDLAVRMLGNVEDAADATQNVFARILRSVHRWPTPPPREWIFKVAINAIRNHARDLRRRKSLEPGIMDPEIHAGSAQHDDHDRSEVLRRAIDHLDADERMLITLRYVNGMTLVETASAAGLRRSTTQSRLSAALERLRRLLGEGERFASIPLLEAALGTLPKAAVPEVLSTSLFALALEAKAAAGAGFLVAAAGGVVMTKSMIIGGAVVGAVLFLAGFVGGRVSEPDGEDADGLTRNAAAAERGAIVRAESAEAEAASLRQRLQSKDAELAAAARALASLESGRSGPGSTGAGNETAVSTTDVADAASSNDAEPTVDFSRLAKIVADNLDMLAALGKGPSLSTEERALMMQIQKEGLDVAQKVAAITDQPFMNESLFKSIMGAFVVGPLGLDDAARRGLEADIAALFTDRMGSFDASNALPNEVWMQRKSMVDGVLALAQDRAGTAGSGRADAIRAVSDKLLAGNFAIHDIGLGERTNDAGNGQIYDNWRETYGLSSTQEPTARALAAEYRVAAWDVLQRFGRDAAGAAPLSWLEQCRLESEFGRLQSRFEHRLGLSDAQRAKAANSLPLVMRFRAGDGTSTSRRNGAFF